MSEGLPEEVRKVLLKKHARDGEFRTEAPKVNLEVQRLISPRCEMNTLPRRRAA